MFRDIAARQTRAPLCVFDVEVLTLNALVIVDSIALGTFAVTLEARLLVFHRANTRTSLEITIGALLSQGVNATSCVQFVLEDETAMTRVAAAHHGVTLGSRASSSAERSTRLAHTRVVIVLDKRALVNAVRPVAENAYKPCSYLCLVLDNQADILGRNQSSS